jgi:hypothetical protein
MGLVGHGGEGKGPSSIELVGISDFPGDSLNEHAPPALAAGGQLVGLKGHHIAGSGGKEGGIR